MKSKNNSEKRCRQKRIAARKRRERSAYREKYKEQDRRENELSEHNRKLESGIKKAGIWFVVIAMWAWVMFVFVLLFVSLWSESVFLNWLFSLLYIGSVFMAMWVYANFVNRCYFYVSLAERPVLPVGVRVPTYFVDWDRRRYLDDVFEELNKEDVFTQCNAKQMVLTSESKNSGAWFLLVGASFFLLWVAWENNGHFWESDAYVGVLLCLVFFMAAVFFYVYNRKKVFKIDREAKTITIPPVSCLGKSKVVPWQQAVVAYCPGLISSGRRGTMVKDYLSLTTKDNLPYGPSLGFRCDSYTQYRFAKLICEYMTVSDVDDLSDIQGFEDIVAKIKAS